MNNWQKIDLGEILTESKIEAKNSNSDERIRVLLNASGVIKRPIIKETEGATNYFERKAGQFIYGKQNLHKGAFGIIPNELNGYSSSSDLPAFDVHKSCLPEWIDYFLRHGDFYLSLIDIAKGAATKRIQPKDLFKVKIPLPSIDVQKKVIAEFVEKEISQKVILSEVLTQKQLLSQLKQSILQEAIQGKLTSEWRSNHPELVSESHSAVNLLKRIKAEKERLIKSKILKKGNTINHPVSLISEVSIPKTWTWCKADDILFVTKLAGFEYTKHISLQISGEIPVIRAQNVRPMEIDKSNLLYIDKKTSHLLDRCSLTKKCLLVTFIGAGIGDVATFKENTRWHLAPNVAKMEPFNDCDNIINISYLNYFLLSPVGRKEIHKHIKATAQPSLSMGTIRDIDFPIPPLEEQKAIVEKVEELMHKCQGLEEEIKQNEANAQMLMQAVLKEAFEG